MDRNKRIAKNTVIFGVGNFGSKVLVYIMVLVYTHYIGKSELGYYDIILTTVNLLQPLLLMAFDEGIYRWLIGNDEDKGQIISTCIKSTSITTIVAIALLFIVNSINQIEYVGLIALFIASSMVFSMSQNAIRGLTNNRLYAFSGILNSVLLLVFELISLIVLSMGIDGLLISKVIADTLTICFMYYKEPTLHGFITKPFNKDLATKIFKYSFPLVPNQLSWWIVNSSDRYIILAFLGTAYNGIYSISNKFPTIITSITGVVYFALQETIIKEYNSDDRDEFYGSTFKNYYVLLFSLVCGAVPATKLIINWFVSEEYIVAWQFTGFLYLSTVFSALSSFLGIGYQISKETKRSVLSTVSAAGVNLTLNILLIKYLGLHAASLSTFVAYLCLFIIRIFHSKKYFTLNVNWAHFEALSVLSCAVIIVSFYSGIVSNMLLMLVSSIIALYMNRSMLQKVLKREA